MNKTRGQKCQADRKSVFRTHTKCIEMNDILGQVFCRAHSFHVPIKVVFVSRTGNPQLNPINITLVSLAGDGSWRRVAQVAYYKHSVQELSVKRVLCMWFCVVWYKFTGISERLLSWRRRSNTSIKIYKNTRCQTSETIITTAVRNSDLTQNFLSLAEWIFTDIYIYAYMHINIILIPGLRSPNAMHILSYSQCITICKSYSIWSPSGFFQINNNNIIIIICPCA